MGSASQIPCREGALQNPLGLHYGGFTMPVPQQFQAFRFFQCPALVLEYLLTLLSSNKDFMRKSLLGLLLWQWASLWLLKDFKSLGFFPVSSRSTMGMLCYSIFVIVWLGTLPKYAFSCALQSQILSMALYSDQFILAKAQLFSWHSFIFEEEPPPPRSTPWGAYRSAISCGVVPLSAFRAHIYSFHVLTHHIW